MSNLRIEGIRFKARIGFPWGKNKWYPGDLNGRDFEWFLGKSESDEEFIAYLSSQLEPELYVSQSGGRSPSMPYFFVGGILRRFYRDAWSPQK